MTPPDPDRYPRESNDIARASAEEQKRSNRKGLWLGIATLAVTAAVGIPAGCDAYRGWKDDAEQKQFEAGAPIQISAGESYYGPGWWATDEDLGDQNEGKPFDMSSTATNTPSWGWLWSHWTPLNATGTAVNVLSKHKHTVLVQGVDITHLKCTEATTRTLFRNPTIGDGGTLEQPAKYALNIEAARPVPRQLTTDNRPGDPKSMNITLDQGDQREVVIQFFAAARSCTFQAALIVSSEGKRYKQQLPATWDGEKPESYTFHVTAPPADFKYKTLYVATSGLNPVIERVTPSDITWDKFNRPAYVGPQ
ncbi:hypothetical protein [Streptomyces carpinensis]|uniref:Uncharacterized protein n=1 Tax=Streptomyces carpinensis TaxID=66369 RepID=A0ABV1VUR5_9ACTN|nr:hypothetical protein [Streptomyces carpinensis]